MFPQKNLKSFIIAIFSYVIKLIKKNIFNNFLKLLNKGPFLKQLFKFKNSNTQYIRKMQYKLKM